MRYFVVRLNGVKYLFQDIPLGQKVAKEFAKRNKRKVFYWGEYESIYYPWDIFEIVNIRNMAKEYGIKLEHNKIIYKGIYK